MSGLGQPIRTPTDRRRRLRLRPAGAALALATLALADATRAAVDPLPDFAWSSDATALAAVERADGRLVALRIVDGAAGEPRGEIDADSVAAALGADATRAGALELRLAAGGAHALLLSGGRAALWTRKTAELVPLPPARFGSEPPFSPAGDRLGYVRDGELWLRDLATGAESRLTEGAAAEPELAWAPDGRSIALPVRRVDGALGITVVDVADTFSRSLETGELGALVGLRWRFDAGAIGVVARSPDGTRLVLALCQPERGYCRRLAERAWSAGRVPVDDLRFLPDGFVWGGPQGGLAFYDTLGRARRQLVPADLDLLGVPAVFDATREVAAVVAGADGAGLARLLLIELGTAARSEIAAAPGWPQVEISEPLRAWIRPRESADGTRFTGYLLERIDGEPILAFDLSGAPEGR